jgi:hypothetical protein
MHLTLFKNKQNRQAEVLAHKLTDLTEAIRQYRSEVEHPISDGVMRNILRERMFTLADQVALDLKKVS